ncbi:S9 family peptidase [Halolamina litorea]|uniref:S9 family peptidase n=1 Tax=Halolamina litorea TaxID=1515593 RepID=A0ABD6BST1_9EURY|nr:S9 family peptidase [Halolamina litorea]
MTETSDPDVMNLADALSVSWRPGTPRRLTYVERERGEDTVYDYRFDIDASERVKAFDERISGRWGQVDWCPEGRHLLYTRGGDVRVLDTETGEESTPAPSESFDNAPRFSPDGDRIAFVSGRGDAGNDIWVVDRDGSNLERITEGANPHDDKRWEPSWSPEGDRIAFVGAADWHGRDWADEAHVVHVGTGEVDRLTRGLSVTAVPSWSPSGDKVAFFAKEVAEPWYRHSEDVHVHNLRTGNREIYPVEASHQYNVQQPLWDGEDRLFFPTRERGKQQLEAMLLHDESDARGIPTRVTVHDGVFGAGPVALSPDGEYLGFSYAEAELPPHPRAIPTAGGHEEQLRDPEVPEGVIVPENVTYESFDGGYVNGYLYKPEGVTEDDPAPTLVQVHGGGHFQYGDGWHPIEQYLAAHGYVVFAIDFRGSGGYGRPFQELSMGDWHGGQVDDAREAARYVRSLPYTTDSVGIYGGSWGGFMTLMSITRYPEVWDAGVEWYGVSNQFTDYEEVDRVGRLLTERDMGGTPDEQEDLYRAASAAFNLDRVETPLRVLHGAEDERVPINQAEELIDELDDGPVPFDATIYENEGHGFRDEANRRDSVEQTRAWFDEHL